MRHSLIHGAPSPTACRSGNTMSAQPKQMLLDPGFELTLRPMRYPQFYDMYRDAI